MERPDLNEYDSFNPNENKKKGAGTGCLIAAFFFILLALNTCTRNVGKGDSLISSVLGSIIIIVIIIGVTKYYYKDS
jgi:hypothetical protein